MQHAEKPRRAGILFPVFAIRREDDLGIGDTAGLRQLIDWAAAHGLGFIQLLPINATGGDSSPYNAISSVALDPLTLDLSPGVVPGLSAREHAAILARHDLARLRAGRVNYPAVRALKQELLRAAFAGFRKLTADRGAKAEFRAFCGREDGWLDDYAAFRLFMEEAGHEDWTSWPAAFGTPEAARREVAHRLRRHPVRTRAELDFHKFTQWLCFTQWHMLRDYGRTRGVRLMGDVPYGISYCSADVFFQPGQFDLSWLGGAPPETYFKDDLFTQKWGQNWGIPLYRWDVMAADGHAWWRRRVAKTCEVFDIFRIDHVLGFYRIYSFPWRPQRNPEFLPLTEAEAAARTGGRLPHFIAHDDDTPEHKAANLADGDRRLRVVVEAAGNAEVVAEDLGTVPDYVRPHLLSLDVPGFKICHWEEDPHGNVIPGDAYPNCAFATYATHDHDPMRVHWNKRREETGSADEATRWLAHNELKRLGQFAGYGMDPWHAPPYDTGVRRRLLEALLACRGRFAACMITDLFDLEDRFNVPGVAGPQNWSARLPVTVARMTVEEPYAGECRWLAEAVRRTGRSG